MIELNRKYLEKEYGKNRLGDLEHIDVSNCKINEIEANTFKGLSKLEWISLNHNEIACLDENIFANLSNLKHLHLNNNKLEEIYLKTFKGLVNLEELWLNSNQIKWMNGKLFWSLSKLVCLNLYGNQLNKLDVRLFAELNKLESLWLNDNKIENIDPILFENLSSLKELGLDKNMLSRIDSNTFKGLANLEFLSLNGNRITDIDETSFESLRNLKELLLDNNKLRYINANTFKGVVKLENLSLNDNRIKNIDTKAFQDLSNLRVLMLENNRLRKVDRKCFLPLRSIEVIQLYENNLEAVSFYIPTELPNSINEKLDQNGFLSDWYRFLSQFSKFEIDTEEILKNENRELKDMMEKLRLENERVESKNKRLQKEMEKSKKTQQNRINPKRNLEEEINDLMASIKIRCVKSNQISSSYMKKLSNQELIDQVIDKKYKIIEYLGRGGFGKVFKVLDLTDEKNSKVIKIITTVIDNEWEKEATLMSKLEHKNILKCQDVLLLKSIEKVRHPCIFSEYCHNGDLDAQIRKKRLKQEQFDDKTILNWMLQASDGVRYLHSLHVIHRDIKPKNILLTQDNVIKLADLGSAKVMKESLSTSTFVGTREYMSPEQRNSRSYSFPTDIWSLGCVMYELAYLHRFANVLRIEHSSVLFSPTIKRMLVEKPPDDRIDAEKLYDDLEKLKYILDM